MFRALRARFFVSNSGIIFCPLTHTEHEVITMSYVNPAIRPQFETMPSELKNAVLQMDIRLESMADLMTCLERIVAEQE